ncbi:MAG: putative lipid II flippase FtsW [Thermoanaerobaculia bacterium]
MAKKLAFDPLLFSSIIVLLTLGLAMVFSAGTAVAQAQGLTANAFLVKQVAWALLGLALGGALMLVDYRRLRRGWLVYGSLLGVVALLVVVLFSPALNETHRWIFLGPLSIQPSELAKLALILFLAYQIQRHEERFAQDLPTLLPTAVVLALLAGLVLLQPDLGTACMLVLIAATVLFLAGLPWRWVLLGGASGVVAVGLAILAADYRRERLLAFLAPEKDPLGSGYQALQSLIAVGSGGFTGLGVGQSLQKLHFLPYPHSDFIYAIIGEELGLVGALAVVVLFGLLLWRGMRAGYRAPDLFGRYLAYGLTLGLVLQALINVSVTLSLLPTKGIPLPFISYGGSSLVVTLASCGILLNVSQHG